MNLWKKNNFISLIFIAFLCMLFWHPVLFGSDFFYDDWGFISAFQEGKVSFQYFLSPHNEHFMPLFKGIFYAMFSIFGLNVTPYMGLLILVHIVNASLFCHLCRLMFPKNARRPIILAMIFLSSSAYFEVLHWFILLSTAGSLLFLQITLIYLHRYAIEREKKFLWISVGASFFIPMNFSLGLIGILFIGMYYLWILQPRPKPTILIPYGIAWGGFLILYVMYVVPTILAGGEGATSMNLSQGIRNTILGFFGYGLKSLGISILMEPINMWIAGILLLNIFFVGIFLFFYLVLNKNRARLPLVEKRGIALFALLGATASYGAIAFARTDLTADAFLNWGRYQFFSVFFLTIFLGTFLPQLIEIFSQVFDRRRLRIYLSILFLAYLMGHFVTIREKSSSSIRLEGNFPIPKTFASIDKSTNTNISEAIWRV